MYLIDKVSNHFPYCHKTLSNLQAVIELEAKGEYRSYRLPKNKEWKKLRYVCRLVAYIYNAAEVFFFTDNPTTSLYLHNLRELQASLRKESTSPNRLSVATNLLKMFDKFWNDMYLVLVIATMMDPRCKMKYVEFSSLKYEDNSPFDLKPSDSDSDNKVLGQTLDLGNDLPRNTLERLQKCDFGFNCLDEYNEFLKPNQPPKSEIEWYLDEPVLPWSNDFDLMSWWRNESPKYPILSKMARDLLAIPFSVVSSNEAFIYRDFRTADETLDALGPVLRNALVCTRSYFQKA
ncbi:hypothetical protein POM88_005331 [Heracleum sosnowskyi]|uniref:Transposase n=1 Tax=Heracleum sosnowskyi TaxID=360622 RepID=A0AAD8JLD2_9APIA|nr:hypothetical protein POM88_005331 [Heracleum sosnowskyi]